MAVGAVGVGAVGIGAEGAVGMWTNKALQADGAVGVDAGSRSRRGSRASTGSRGVVNLENHHR